LRPVEGSPDISKFVEELIRFQRAVQPKDLFTDKVLGTNVFHCFLGDDE